MMNIKRLLYLTVLGSVPVYFWFKLYKTYKTLKKEYEEEKLFYERHNCVVMYANGKGISGWPPLLKRTKFPINDSNSLLAPFIYFIETAQNCLDIAVMSIKAPIVIRAIEQASDRGVKVRIMLNFVGNQSSTHIYRNLMRKGIEVTFYISEEHNLNSIMHYKYMLKDYNKNGGFLCMGSLNISNLSAIANYEDFIFTSNLINVKAFQENFEFCWNLIKTDNENIVNKSVLKEYNLL